MVTSHKACEAGVAISSCGNTCADLRAIQELSSSEKNEAHFTSVLQYNLDCPIAMSSLLWSMRERKNQDENKILVSPPLSTPQAVGVSRN